MPRKQVSETRANTCARIVCVPGNGKQTGTKLVCVERLSGIDLR